MHFMSSHEAKNEAFSPVAEPGSLLRLLAARVRVMRDERRWTRAELAKRSGLSIRFLARVESGDGNISLVRLAHLAGALGTSADALIRPDEGMSRVVTLVGLRGAGKSTVGPILARRLGLPFLEMDASIRERSGLPIDQIFELHGERYYRQLELETLERLLDRGIPTVLAAAGGVVNEPSTWEMLLRRTTVVWLKARPEDHWNRVVAQGDRRPMRDHPDAMAEVRARLAARERLYSQAHVVVDTSDKTAAVAAGEIESRITELQAARRGASGVR